jgi:hypothetical protein
MNERSDKFQMTMLDKLVWATVLLTVIGILAFGAPHLS